MKILLVDGGDELALVLRVRAEEYSEIGSTSIHHVRSVTGLESPWVVNEGFDLILISEELMSSDHSGVDFTDSLIYSGIPQEKILVFSMRAPVSKPGKLQSLSDPKFYSYLQREIRKGLISSGDEDIFLVVDLNGDVFDRICKILPGKKILRARSSELAISLLDESYLYGVTPDAIFFALNIPNMNGMEFLHAIRGADRFKDVPVIFFPDPYMVHEDSVAIGSMSYVLFKPMTLGTIQSFLGKKSDS